MTLTSVQGRMTFRFDDDDERSFPGFNFTEPPASITCWEQPRGTGPYRLAEPLTVHWNPASRAENLTLKCMPGSFVVCVTINDQSVVDPEG